FKQAQYFGFTGTPRFETNASQDGRSTADIFDKCLHTYLIKEAIRDGNVLGFSVEYINTFDRSSRIYQEEYVKDIDTSEVWMEDQRIALVRDHILENYHKKTRDKMYTAMFTVQSRPMATKYYEAFQQAKQEGKHDLNIAGIFTYHPNEDAEEKEEAKHSRDVLEEMIEDYNATFETNFSS